MKIALGGCKEGAGKRPHPGTRRLPGPGVTHLVTGPLEPLVVQDPPSLAALPAGQRVAVAVQAAVAFGLARTHDLALPRTRDMGASGGRCQHLWCGLIYVGSTQEGRGFLPHLGWCNRPPRPLAARARRRCSGRHALLPAAAHPSPPLTCSHCPSTSPQPGVHLVQVPSGWQWPVWQPLSHSWQVPSGRSTQRKVQVRQVASPSAHSSQPARGQGLQRPRDRP